MGDSIDIYVSKLSEYERACAMAYHVEVSTVMSNTYGGRPVHLAPLTHVPYRKPFASLASLAGDSTEGTSTGRPRYDIDTLHVSYM